MTVAPGRLHVFLGAAPGVGKTVAMLREGRRLRAEGHDVVIGLVETHGRAETLAEIGDLETIPRRRLEHRGVALEEMDVDAILARKPEIVLLDELAHTNAPGSPRTKRWDDVRVLLDAGIDVMTTVNIQHLESLHDLVESITGVCVSETVPDSVLDEADVQLVDLPIEALVERLERGKIYPEATATRALANFFRGGNLTALRELSLRQTAAGVDEHLDRYMREHEIEEVWPAAELVLVLMRDGVDAAKALRRAWRLASRLRAELVAAIWAPDSAERQRFVQLAEDLGATTRLLSGHDLGDELLAAALDENAGIVVVSRDPRSGPGRDPLIDQLTGAGGQFDVVIVPSSAQPAPPGRDRPAPGLLDRLLKR